MLDKSLEYNKLVFLNDKGDITITNTEGWLNYNGVTYSNESFLGNNEFLNDNGKIQRYSINNNWSDENYGQLATDYYSFE